MTALLYGAVMLAGGVMGYRKAGSVPSLIGGGVIGGLALLGGALMLSGTVDGRGLALLGATIAILFFGWTLSRGILNRTKVARPGLLLALSAVTAGILVWGS